MAKDHGRKQGYFIIVEGYLDAIACHQYGIRNAVATLGTALTEGHLRLMRRFADKLVLIFDPDPAGVKASLRGFDLFVSSGMKVNVVSLAGRRRPGHVPAEARPGGFCSPVARVGQVHGLCDRARW